MSLISILTGNYPDSVPYPKPPEKSKRRIIYFNDLPAWEYLTPEQTTKYKKGLFGRFRLRDYDGAIVNLNGGGGIAEEAFKSQNYHGPIGEAAYKEPPGGFGATIEREIPEYFWGKKVIIFEDVWETGGVITEMRKKLDPRSLTVFVTRKDRHDQIYIPNTLYAFLSVPEWIGGNRMNLEYPGDKFYPPDAFRNFDGIVIRPPDDILQSLSPFKPKYTL